MLFDKKDAKPETIYTSTCQFFHRRDIHSTRSVNVNYNNALRHLHYSGQNGTPQKYVFVPYVWSVCGN